MPGFTAQYNGNIASQNRTAGSPTQTNTNYAYTYDYLNRLTSGISNDNYNETVAYDLNGNISALQRTWGTTTAIDNLGYTFTGTNGYTNQVQTIADAAPDNTTHKGYPVGTFGYQYDDNGNMTSDASKTLSITTYNQLNLPQAVTLNGATITYTYDATGRKLRKVSSAGTNTDYIDGIEYDGGAINFAQTEKGRVLLTGGVTNYEYNLSDNLGNVRATYDTHTTTPTPVQQDDYMPFGYEISRGTTTGLKNEYLYNKKELQEELGDYDYGARFYDPVIARWTTPDPLAENNRRWTPYNYAVNNPIRYIDPDGRDTAQRNAAVREAARWVAGNDNGKGNTYRLGAKGDDGPGSEIDCSGLISKVVVAGGEKDPNHGTSNGITNIDNNLPNVDPKDVVPGNIVTLSNDSHGGLITLVQRDKQGNIINEQMTDSGGKPSSGTSGPRVSNLIKDGKLTYWGKLIVSYNKFDTKPDAPSSGGSTSSATTTTQTSTMGSLWNSFKKAVSSLMDAATH